MNIRPMLISDHPQLIQLLKETPGVSLQKSDSIEATERYLQRNPGLNLVVEDKDKIVGCVMCGHDGRRGYLQHLIVNPSHRNQGLGEQLFRECLSSLENIGIEKNSYICL